MRAKNYFPKNKKFGVKYKFLDSALNFIPISTEIQTK